MKQVGFYATHRQIEISALKEFNRVEESFKQNNYRDLWEFLSGNDPVLRSKLDETGARYQQNPFQLDQQSESLDGKPVYTDVEQETLAKKKEWEDEKINKIKGLSCLKP